MQIRRLGYTLLATVMTSVGCFTRYGPEGFSGGYKDYPAGRGVYYVSFSGNGFTSKSSVAQMWHRRCAEICDGERNYEIVSRDSSTSTDFYTNDGQLKTVNKSFAEGYIRCLNESTSRARPRRPRKPKISSEVAAAQQATRKHPKLPELGMTPKESKTLCKIQGGVQKMKVSAARDTNDEGLTEGAAATYSCRVGGILVYKATVAQGHQGFISVTGYYEGTDVDDFRENLERRFGPPDAVKVHNGYRFWSWQDRIGLRAYDSGVKVIFKGAPGDPGATALEPSTDVYPGAAPSPTVDESTLPSLAAP
jgi:hypothetical protein